MKEDTAFLWLSYRAEIPADPVEGNDGIQIIGILFCLCCGVLPRYIATEYGHCQAIRGVMPHVHFLMVSGEQFCLISGVIAAQGVPVNHRDGQFVSAGEAGGKSLRCSGIFPFQIVPDPHGKGDGLGVRAQF